MIKAGFCARLGGAVPGVSKTRTTILDLPSGTVPLRGSAHSVWISEGCKMSFTGCAPQMCLGASLLYDCYLVSLLPLPRA